MFVFLLISFLKFHECFGCIPTPSLDGTPEILVFPTTVLDGIPEISVPEVPALACTACVAPPMINMPGEPIKEGDGNGRIVPGDPTDAGCNTFVITCDADGDDDVVIIANMQYITLSSEDPSERTATLVCNDNGELVGITVRPRDNYPPEDYNKPVIVTSFYCLTEW